ncbi:MAG: hypothetical protein II229_06280, partial [Clostridia bacterium]|nr:hypothetical protein [Clostridia bacterium]
FFPLFFLCSLLPALLRGSPAPRLLVAGARPGLCLQISTVLRIFLFSTVISDGALPRKTFSMGHAEDKRFYTEARAIR